MWVWRCVGLHNCVCALEQNHSKRADFIYPETVHHRQKSGREVKYLVVDLPRLSSGIPAKPEARCISRRFFRQGCLPTSLLPL
jgi:hypothetical protein